MQAGYVQTWSVPGGIGFAVTDPITPAAIPPPSVQIFMSRPDRDPAALSCHLEPVRDSRQNSL